MREHLARVPISTKVGDGLDLVEERRACLIFDRMVAFHLQRGIAVLLGAVELYAGLAQRFVARGGMYFLPGQVTD